jgi:hypothetical protein
MRDGIIVEGQTITYDKERFTIGHIYFIPNNPELYVQLKKDGFSLNVKLSEIIPNLTSKKKLDT